MAEKDNIVVDKQANTKTTLERERDISSKKRNNYIYIVKDKKK